MHERLVLVLGRLANIVGKGEVTCNQHFLLFLFSKYFFLEVVKRLCGKGRKVIFLPMINIEANQTMPDLHDNLHTFESQDFHLIAF